MTDFKTLHPGDGQIVKAADKWPTTYPRDSTHLGEMRYCSGFRECEYL